jgi:hypothetical protein
MLFGTDEVDDVVVGTFLDQRRKEVSTNISWIKEKLDVLAIQT